MTEKERRRLKKKQARWGHRQERRLSAPGRKLRALAMEALAPLEAEQTGPARAITWPSPGPTWNAAHVMVRDRSGRVLDPSVNAVDVITLTSDGDVYKGA